MSKQVGLPKISLILQKVKISQKTDIHPFCTKAFNWKNRNNIHFENKKLIHCLLYLVVCKGTVKLFPHFSVFSCLFNRCLSCTQWTGCCRNSWYLRTFLVSQDNIPSYIQSFCGTNGSFSFKEGAQSGYSHTHLCWYDHHWVHTLLF